ncbi:MAG: hypothetical protein K2G12_01890, partial [Prevotella sp.]|nr:hypothetical protein [Prevotella sp.]
MELLYIIISLAAGFALGMLFMKSKNSSFQTRISTLENETESLRQSAETRLAEQKALLEKQMEPQL